MCFSRKPPLWLNWKPDISVPLLDIFFYMREESATKFIPRNFRVLVEELDFCLDTSKCFFKSCHIVDKGFLRQRQASFRQFEFLKNFVNKALFKLTSETH